MTKSLAASLEDNDCHLLMQQTSHEELCDLDSELPTDTHLIRAEKDFQISIDAVRAHRMADIFDSYHDAGYVIQEIKRGYGRIKPKLFQNSKK
jgi:microcystin-dependent protein